MKPINEQRGVAIFTAMMLVVLISGISLLVFQNAAIEKMITAYVKREAVSLSLAEAGIEQAIFWMAYPEFSPEKVFFNKRFCDDATDFSSKSGTVLPDDLRDQVGDVTLRIYHNATHQQGSCTVEAKDTTGKGIQVDLGRSPMPNIVVPITGSGGYSVPDNQLKWCNPRCFIEGLDPIDPVKTDKIKLFIKRYGRSFTVSSDGCLRENRGGDLCESFRRLFSLDNKIEKAKYDLVYIHSTGEGKASPLTIGPGPYRGYFYFSGDIIIEDTASGNHSGLSIEAQPPTEIGHSSLDFIQIPKQTVFNLDLDGLFYTTQKIILNDQFQAYGALYAGSGFDGDLQNLHIWYNNTFSSADYKGIIPMIRIPATWQAM